jgi:hypothetical protein
LNSEKLPRDNEKSTAVKRAAIPQSDASRRIRPSAQLPSEGSPLGSSKSVGSAKVEQPLRDNDSASNPEGEEALLAVTKVLSIRQLTSAMSVPAKDSGRKVPLKDADGQEAPENATKIMDVRPSAAAVPPESENKTASEEKKISESPSAEAGSQDIASRGVKIQPPTPFIAKKELEKSATYARPGNSSTNGPAVNAFEEPQMADGDDRTRFFQRPGFTEPAEHPKDSPSQKAPPFSAGLSEPASRRNIDPSPGEAPKTKEKVTASPVHTVPAPHLAGLNGKAAVNLPATASTSSSNSTNSLLVPLVLTLNLCTAALVVVVVAFLVHTMGGLPHVLSLFRR